MYRSYIVENTWIDRNHMDLGWGNGYVVIPDGNILHGIGTRDLYDIDVHGGVTWAESAFDTTNTPKWVKDSDWIIGFDTCHGGNNIRHHDKEYVEHQTNGLVIELSLLEKELKRK